MTEPTQKNALETVIVVGGGVAGLSAATALADAGFQVTVLERRGYLGGRASSYLHPGTQEVIDNCQHVLFGCCTALVDFYKRIGVEDRIFWDSRMTLIEPGGRRSTLKPAGLPAPMHGLPGILRASCFSIADKVALVRAFTAIMLGSKPDPKMSLADWLKRQGQTKGAMHRFWWLVIASALNADLDCIGIEYAFKVIRELFLNSAWAGAMGMSRVPLSELYKGASEYLAARGGEIRYQEHVEGARWDEAGQRWRVMTRNGELESSHLVLALPFEGLQKLLPGLPEADGVAGLADQLAHHQHWPICSAHLWFDRQITELDHAVLLDRDIHWMYHKSRWQEGRDGGGSYVELVISVSREFAALSREEALGLAVSQLAEYFPVVKEAKLVKSALTKDLRATFGVPPGIDAYRPGAVSPWSNCYLAGDWVATGWPATMESACRSGVLAAEALCRAVGAPRTILAPELKPTGLMRLLS